MAALYKKYLKLLEIWPVEPTKKGRDFGEFLREQVQLRFRNGQLVGDRKECEKTLESLQRLANDHYLKQYPRTAEFSSSCLKAEHAKILVSNDFITEPYMSTWRKYYERFRKWQKS